MKAVVAIVFGLLIVSEAGAQTPAKCDKGPAMLIQACWQKEINSSRRAMDLKVAEACRKQVGGEGAANADKILACRAERMAKIVEGIN